LASGAAYEISGLGPFHCPTPHEGCGVTLALPAGVGETATCVDSSLATQSELLTAVVNTSAVAILNANTENIPANKYRRFFMFTSILHQLTIKVANTCL
jgi:hypothetical protein